MLRVVTYFSTPHHKLQLYLQNTHEFSSRVFMMTETVSEPETTNLLQGAHLHEENAEKMDEITPEQANKELLEAILSRTDMVLHWLKHGASPDTCALTFDAETGTRRVEPALHYIVRLLYEGADTQPNPREFREMLSILIQHGANIHARCEVNFAHVGTKAQSKKFCPPNIKSVTPLELARELKLLDAEANAARRTREMDEAIGIFQDAEDCFYPVAAKTAIVRESALNLWRSLLLSDRFSDVMIDAKGSHIPAHKCVLLAASEYFESLFRFHNDQGKNVIVAEHEPTIVEAVLTYIYLGTIDSNLLQERTSELVDIAQEWHLVSLQQECEPIVARCICIANAGATLELAHRLDSAQLKTACFNFIHRHAAKVLVRPEILKIPQEDPQLWAELVARMSGI